MSTILHHMTVIKVDPNNIYHQILVHSTINTRNPLELVTLAKDLLYSNIESVLSVVFRVDGTPTMFVFLRKGDDALTFDPNIKYVPI